MRIIYSHTLFFITGGTNMGIAKRSGIRMNYLGNKEIKTELKCCLISNIRVNIPQWTRDLSLAPRWQDVDAVKRNIISFEEFKDRYYQYILQYKNPEEVYKKYEGWYLLCCEKDPTHCHRTILAEWLQKFGYDYPSRRR